MKKLFYFTVIFFVALNIVHAQSVIIMDSKNKNVVYDYSVYKNGGSNATEIEEIISPLNVTTRVINTSISWLSTDNISLIIDENPDLIIIHTSAFFDRSEPGSTKIYDDLITFLKRISNRTDSNILIYSRYYHVWGGINGLKQIILNNVPSLSYRLKLIEINTFTDNSNRIWLRKIVNNML
jgi:hypothetical protein